MTFSFAAFPPPAILTLHSSEKIIPWHSNFGWNSIPLDAGMRGAGPVKSMIEVVLVGAVVLSLFAVQYGSAVDPELLLVLSVALIAAGLAIGLPAGLGYHILLARALKVANLDAKRWWLRPTSFHDDLPAATRRRFMPWFRVGAAGFLIAVVGCGFLLLLVVAVSRP